METIRFIDLFAGVGGFHYGLNAANSSRRQSRLLSGSEDSSNINNSSMATQQFTCVYSNEWDKYANAVYRKHFGQCDNRDIRTVEASEIPDFDLLVGGFPCQSFSIAGKRGGFDDTRGTLFFEIARIIKQKQPRLLLLENVKGLLSHDKGNTFRTILSTLDELGYDAEWQVLNSKNFGVPQSRERVYIVGHLRGTTRPEIFPLKGTNPKTLEYIGGIPSKEDRLRLEDGKTFSRNFPQGSRVYNDSGVAATLSSQSGGFGGKTGLYAVLTPDRIEKRQNGRRIKEDGEPSFTLTAQDRHGVYDGVTIRRLTPIECERLQGFPDNWTESGLFNDTKLSKQLGCPEIVNISDTQRYKMMGNAVTTNVITVIGKKLLENL